MVTVHGSKHRNSPSTKHNVPYFYRLPISAYLWTMEDNNHEMSVDHDDLQQKLRSLPLPPFFHKEKDIRNGKVWYVNDLTSEKTETHPADEYLRQKRTGAAASEADSSPLSDTMNETSPFVLTQQIEAVQNDGTYVGSLDRMHYFDVPRFV